VEQRDDIIKYMQENGIECTVYFPSIHLQPFYKQKFGYQKGHFPVSESVSDRVIALPFYGALKEDEIKYVCEKLKSGIIKQKIK
jgi:perosamine synthetase